jgi:hypothetical protein
VNKLFWNNSQEEYIKKKRINLMKSILILLSLLIIAHPNKALAICIGEEGTCTVDDILEETTAPYCTDDTPSKTAIDFCVWKCVYNTKKTENKLGASIRSYKGRTLSLRKTKM